MELQLMLNHFFERVRKDANFNAFLIDLEYNNIAYYIYFVATGNVKIITHAGHFISIKSNRKLIKVNSTPNTQLIKLTSANTFRASIPMKNTVPIWQRQAFLNGLWN